MKNKKSIYLIVSISLFVGLLHFIVGPDYNGIYKEFVRGYLLDILLPMNLYLLLQISLRKNITVYRSRIISALVTFSFGVIVEILQFKKIHFLGETYDSLDILMYAIGVGLGLVLDLTVVDRLEKKAER